MGCVNEFSQVDIEDKNIDSELVSFSGDFLRNLEIYVLNPGCKETHFCVSGPCFYSSGIPFGSGIRFKLTDLYQLKRRPLEMI